MENTTQTERKEIDIKKLQSAVHMQYGFELDETSLIILMILTDQQYLNFSKQNKIINEATKKITDSQKSIQVDKDRPGWQAFCFGFGKLGLALIIAITIITVLFNLYLNNDKEKNTAVAEWYQNYYSDTKHLFPKKIMADYLKKHPFPKEYNKKK